VFEKLGFNQSIYLLWPLQVLFRVPSSGASPREQARSLTGSLNWDTGTGGSKQEQRSGRSPNRKLGHPLHSKQQLLSLLRFKKLHEHALGPANPEPFALAKRASAFLAATNSYKALLAHTFSDEESNSSSTEAPRPHGPKKGTREPNEPLEQLERGHHRGPHSSKGSPTYASIIYGTRKWK